MRSLPEPTTESPVAQGHFLTTQEVARFLCVSVRTIETLIASGELRPVYVTPRCRRFDPAAISAFAHSRARRPGAHRSH